MTCVFLGCFLSLVSFLSMFQSLPFCLPSHGRNYVAGVLLGFASIQKGLLSFLKIQASQQAPIHHATMEEAGILFKLKCHVLCCECCDSGVLWKNRGDQIQKRASTDQCWPLRWFLSCPTLHFIIPEPLLVRPCHPFTERDLLLTEHALCKISEGFIKRELHVHGSCIFKPHWGVANSRFTSTGFCKFGIFENWGKGSTCSGVTFCCPKAFCVFDLHTGLLI